MLKIIVNILIKFKLFSLIIDFLHELAYKILSLRKYIEYKKSNAFHHANDFIKEEVVAAGPFKGLNYKGIASFCSTMYPKLLGTYESELHQSINNIIKKKYQRLIDIGSAEGYYAVGIPFAMKDHSIEIVAVEISQIAINNLKKLIVNNSLINNIKIVKKFDSNDYLDDKKTLLIMDCEGSEVDYLKKLNKHCLLKWDFIIEVHVQIKRDIMKEIVDMFHDRNIIKIKSIDDYHKIEEMSHLFPNDFDDNTKLLLLSENRRTGMYWLSIT